MNTLILGGAASGKSAFAERLACERATEKNAPLVYVATMYPHAGGDTGERIQKHRVARAGKGFATVEWWNCDTVPDVCADDGDSIAHGVRPVALVEDVGNVVANYLYPPAQSSANGESRAATTAAPAENAVAANANSAADAIVSKLTALFSACADCIVVTNEISLGGDIPADSRFYADVLAAVNARLAALCEEVYAVVAGIEIVLKNASVV